jgi:hypothetical protein
MTGTFKGQLFARVRNRIPAKLRDPVELLFAKNSVLRTTGWHRSRQEMASVDAAGEPIPWITYPAIRFLEPRIKKNFRVFEFGSGLSTLWWAKRVSQVVSVEHDKEWHRLVSERAPDNVRYLFADGETYVQSAAGEQYEIIVVDGIRRSDCGRAAVQSLSKSGVVLWDNTNEEDDRDGHDFMERQGFRRIDFWGFGPLMAMEWCTTVFYRPDNCLGI